MLKDQAFEGLRLGAFDTAIIDRSRTIYPSSLTNLYRGTLGGVPIVYKESSGHSYGDKMMQTEVKNYKLATYLRCQGILPPFILREVPKPTLIMVDLEAFGYVEGFDSKWNIPDDFRQFFVDLMPAVFELMYIVHQRRTNLTDSFGPYTKGVWHKKIGNRYAIRLTDLGSVSNNEGTYETNMRKLFFERREIGEVPFLLHFPFFNVNGQQIEVTDEWLKSYRDGAIGQILTDIYRGLYEKATDISHGPLRLWSEFEKLQEEYIRNRLL